MSELSDAADAMKDLENALDQGLEHIDRSDLALVDESDYVQPWDRRPDETPEMYSYFTHYRDQGPSRTIQATFDWYVENELGKTRKTHFYDYAKKGEWHNRAEGWDSFNERQYQLARGVAVRNMAERHADKIESAIEGLAVPVVALQRRLAEDNHFIDELAKTDARKLIAMVNAASRTLPMLMGAERLARGMPTEIVSGTIEHQHTVTIERDQIGEVLGILDDAGILDGRSDYLASGEIIDADVVEVHPLSPDSDDDPDDAGDQS